MASSEFEPLKITAHLMTPVISDVWLPLDGVLFYQHCRNDLGPQIVTIPGASTLEEPKGEEVLGGRLPIAYEHGKHWYYRCSWAVWGPYVDGKDHWHKRFDVPLAYLVDFQGRRGKINTSSAKYKAYRMPLFYRSAIRVSWYCLGDAMQIKMLLSTCTHIGKKYSQGWGRVSRWEILEEKEDNSVWRDGCLMRGVPLYHIPKHIRNPEMMRYGIRPSYWDRRNQVDLVVPGVMDAQ